MTKLATHLKFSPRTNKSFSHSAAKCQFSALIWRPYADSNRGLSRERFPARAFAAPLNFPSLHPANIFSEAPWTCS
jgi:hypothetical protein